MTSLGSITRGYDVLLICKKKYLEILSKSSRVEIKHAKSSYLFVRPRISEPPDDSSLELFGDTPECHVLLHAIHAVLKLHPGHIHVADHAANVAHDGGKDENPSQEISDDEKILDVYLGLWRFTC